MDDGIGGGGSSSRTVRGLRRRARAGLAVVVAVLALSGCAAAWASPAGLDAQFVELARAQGRDLPADTAEQAVLVRAGRKICARRAASAATVAERRAATLTRHELDAVTRTFADSRQFTALALRTFCPS
jgi:hypothetical protein